MAKSGMLHARSVGEQNPDVALLHPGYALKRLP
jgi:hypothetical protein